MTNRQFYLIILLLSTAPVKLEQISINNSTSLSNATNVTDIISSGIVVNRVVMITFLLGAPPITLVLHSIMIYILFISKKRTKYTNIFYKLVLTISFGVSYWAGYFFYQGLCQLYDKCPFGELGNTIIASVAQYLFYVCMNMNLLIAFNRFSAVVLANKYEIVFSHKMGLFYIFIIMLISAAENIPGFMYLMKYDIELGTFAFLHNPPKDFLQLAIWLEMSFTYAVHVAIFVLYAWSFIVYKRSGMLTTANKKERRLLIQALVSGSPCFFMMTFHHLIHFPLLELLSGELCVGIDPIVYLWFNREIRADFFELIDETLKKFGIKNLGRLSNTVAAMTSTQARHRLGNLEIGHMKNTVDNIDPPLRSLQD